MKRIMDKTFAALMALTILCSAAALADATAKLGPVSGDVKVRVTMDGEWAPGQAGAELPVNASVKTGPDGESSIEWGGGSVVKLYPLTIVNIDELGDKGGVTNTALSLEQGRALTRIQKLTTPGSTFELRTPTAVAGVRGTVFDAVVSPDARSVTFAVLEGGVSVMSGAVEIILEAGFESVVGMGEPPMDPVAMTPERRTQLEVDAKAVKPAAETSGQSEKKEEKKKDEKAEEKKPEAKKEEKKDEKAEAKKDEKKEEKAEEKKDEKKEEVKKEEKAEEKKEEKKEEVKKEEKEEKKKEEKKEEKKAESKPSSTGSSGSPGDTVGDTLNTVTDQSIDSMTIDNEISNTADMIMESCTEGACVGGTFSF